MRPINNHGRHPPTQFRGVREREGASQKADAKQEQENKSKKRNTHPQKPKSVKLRNDSNENFFYLHVFFYPPSSKELPGWHLQAELLRMQQRKTSLSLINNVFLIQASNALFSKG